MLQIATVDVWFIQINHNKQLITMLEIIGSFPYPQLHAYIHVLSTYQFDLRIRTLTHICKLAFPLCTHVSTYIHVL